MLPYALCSMLSRFTASLRAGSPLRFDLLLACKVVSSPRHQHGKHMKFIILLLAIYLFYRFFLTPQKPLPPPQEPDLFIDHEEVKKENEKNK